MFLQRGLRVAITVAGALAPATQSHALWDDRLELFAAHTVTRDDNVFRLPRDVDPAPLLGSSNKGDTYQTTLVGLNFDVPASQQRFEGGLTLNQTRYNRFRALDLDGHDGRAVWHWRVGSYFNGQFGYADREVLASLANVQSGIQSSTPNFLRIRRAHANARAALTARWRLDGSAHRLEQDNSEVAFRANDLRANGAELTASYVTPPGNSLGLTAAVLDGQLPNRQQVAGFLVDNSYRQHSVAAVAEWAPAGPSRVRLLAGRASRSFDSLPQRDFDGPTWFAGYEWKPTGKLTFAAIAQRDISTAEEVNIGLVVVKRIVLSSVWRATEKIAVEGAIEQADREYRADPGLVLGTVPPREEQVRAAALGLQYRPLRSVTLNLAWRRERRTSPVAFGDYQASITSVGVRFAI